MKPAYTLWIGGKPVPGTSTFDVLNPAELSVIAQAPAPPSWMRRWPLCGGERTDTSGHFCPITLVANIEDGAPLVDQEQFGPVLPIIRFSDPEDALARANASESGLGGSAWSSDPARAEALAARMSCGTVSRVRHLKV